MKIVLKNEALIGTILLLAVPAIVEMGLNTLVGIIDTIMVSRLIGLEGLAAAGFAGQLIFTIIFIFSSFNAGATAMISRSYGEKDIVKLNNIMGQNLTINLGIGIVIAVASLLFAPYLVGIFDVSQDVFFMTVSYFRVYALGIFFMFIAFALKASLRGAGDTLTPMLISGFANALNVVGNYVLITGYGIFPKLGLNGAAWSTTIVRVIEALLLLLVVYRGKNGIKLSISNLKISSNILAPLWRLSSSAAVEQTMMQLAFLTSGIILSRLDTLAEGSFRILLNIESLSFMPAVGFSIAASSLVGKALGEKDQLRALHTGYTATAMGVIWGILMGVFFFSFPTLILKVFTSDRTIIKASHFTMYIIGLNQAPLAFSIVLAGALRGAGDTLGMMWIAGARLWLMFTPLCWLFMITLKTGVTGMWYAEMTSLMVFNFVIFYRFKKMHWAEIAL